MKLLKNIFLTAIFLLPFVLGAQFRADCSYIKGKTNTTLITQPSCNGSKDGLITVLTDYPGLIQRDISYQLNNNPFVASGSLRNVDGGTQRIITLNAADGCRDTLYVLMPQPDSIKLSIIIDTASCQYSGTFQARAMGGSGTFQYRWNTSPVQTTSLLSNVLAFGSYTVTVSDANGCSVSRSAAMPKPNPLKIQFMVQSPGCINQSSGKIILSPENGTAPYNYRWASDFSDTLGTSNILSGVVKGNYYATVSDATGCSYTGSFVVTDPKALSISAKLSTKSCLNDFSGAIDVTVNGGKPSYTYLWSNNQTTASVNTLNSGDYRLIVTDQNGCQLDTTFIMRLNYPVTGNISLQQVSCSNKKDGTATIQVIGGTAPFSYLWSDPLGQNTETANGLDAGTYFVTATDVFGCIIVGSVNIVKPQPLDAQFNIQTTRCADSADGSATVLVSGGNGNPQITWCDGKNGLNRNDLKGGTCKVDIIDSKGCLLQKTIFIPSPSAVEADKVNVTDVLCAGDSNGSAECLAKGGTWPYSYKWSDANGQLTSKIQNLPKGSYTVTMTDSRQCTAVQTVIVNEPLPLGFSVKTVAPKCASEKTGSFAVTVSGGTGSYSYFWKNNAVSGITSAETMAAAGKYNLTITDTNLCNLADTFNISTPAPIEFTISQIKKGCAGSNSSTAEATGISGGGGQYKLIWEGGFNSNAITNLKPGSISVTVTDANSCSATKSTKITEYEPIKTGLAFVMPKCRGSNDGQMAIVSLSGGAGNGIASAYTYKWNDVPAQTTPLATNLPGDKTYEVLITDSSGCTGTASRYLPQPNSIELTAVITNNSCFGLAEGNISVTAKGDNPGFNFLWNDKPNSTTAQISGLRTGNYSVTVSDFKNCTTTETFILKDPDSLGVSNVIIKNNTCRDTAKGSVRLEAIGGNGKLNYLWSNGAVTEFADNLVTGIYTVTITDQNKCTIVRQFSISQPDTVRVSLETTDISCFGSKNGSIKITATGGTAPYVYSLDGKKYSGYNILDQLAAGKYSVFAKDKDGCIGFSSTALAEPKPLHADAGEDQYIEYGATAIVKASYINNTGKATIKWDAPSTDILSCIRCDTVSVKPLETTILTLQVTDANGCLAEDRITIFLKREKGVFVAQAFSPNNDMANDLLRVHGKEGTEVLVFRVFDQWGEQLFEATDFLVNDKNIGWDGVFRGNLMPVGNYVWTVEAIFPSGERELYKGSSLLIR